MVDCNGWSKIRFFIRVLIMRYLFAILYILVFFPFNMTKAVDNKLLPLPSSVRQGQPYFAVKFKRQQQKGSVIFFGTMHTTPFSHYPEPLQKGLISADILVAESSYDRKPKRTYGEFLSQALDRYSKISASILDQNPNARTPVFPIISNAPYLLDGEPWAKKIPSQLRIELTAIFKQLLGRKPGASLSNVSPYSVWVLLQRANALEKHNSGVDSILRKRFKAAGKKMFFLDTAELLATAAPEIMIRRLNPGEWDPKNLPERLSRTSFVQLMIDRIANLYEDHRNNHTQIHGKNTNLEGLELDKKRPSFHPSIHNLAVKRNKVWAEKLLEIIKKNPTKTILVAVGNAHLGEEPSPSLLRLMRGHFDTMEAYYGK